MCSIVLEDLVKHFPECDFFGKKEAVVDKVISFDESLGLFLPNSISWMSDKKGELINSSNLNLGLLVLTKTMHSKFNSSNCNFLVAANPRTAFTKILNIYFKRIWPNKIESTAVIDSTAAIGANCYIGHHVVIEENCVIGANTVILHNTIILSSTKIGNNVFIGCNNTIGNYGFGYEKDDSGKYQLIQHLGKVKIRDFVEIHNNTCIDRGVLSDTEIQENVKIDNLVHVAHGVVIGRNSLVIANAMIGGSATIGQNTWIAPSVSIKNQIHISDNTSTGIGAVILKDTIENSLMIGNPAITMEEHKKWSETKKKLSS